MERQMEPNPKCNEEHNIPFQKKILARGLKLETFSRAGLGKIVAWRKFYVALL